MHISSRKISRTVPPPVIGMPRTGFAGGIVRILLPAAMMARPCGREQGIGRYLFQIAGPREYNLFAVSRIPEKVVNRCLPMAQC
jgi:hypothetical protein